MDESNAELRRRLFNAAARMRKYRKEPRAPKGITPAEAYAVMAIARLEGMGKKARSGEIAKCSHSTPSAISQTLKSLEEKGLITRHRDEGDCRAVTVRLTDEGRAFNARGHELHEQMIDEVLEFLGPEDAEQFVRIMERLSHFPERNARAAGVAAGQAESLDGADDNPTAASQNSEPTEGFNTAASRSAVSNPSNQKKGDAPCV